MMNKLNILEGGQLSDVNHENGQNIEGNVEFKMVVFSTSKMIHVNGKIIQISKLIKSPILWPTLSQIWAFKL